MSRAWPFEDKPEPFERARTPADFVARGREGTDAVVIRIGLNDAQLVLIDGAGRWDRWVYHSLDEATREANALGIDVHVGEYPEEVRVRMNAHQRPADDFDRAAYPEQGRVGPVIPYPENRPRSPEATRAEASPPKPGH
ncbi:MAG TPA: hypothetical protein VIG64_06250 [Actinomycetota bacterium]|jgi:hypothetical protein